MSWTAQRIVEETKKVSSLPTVYYQLTAAVDNPATCNRDMERIIHTDSGLVARLLRIANSAMYTFPSRIDTIGRAITIIGTAQLRELALATSIIRIFKDIPVALVDMRSFWEHSIACAITARALAGFHREANPERYFVAGLLHDIGRILMYDKVPQQMEEALSQAAESNRLLFEVEREVLGFDHAAVGRILLTEWKLPTHTINAVRYHHSPKMDDLYNDATIVHVADIMANSLQLGTSGERLVPPLDTVAWDNLKLDVSLITLSHEQLIRQFEEATQILLS